MSLSTSASTDNSLKSHQLSAITSLLSSSDSSTNSDPWKILIYDTHTRSIISPLLSVSSLRSLGVTLHLMLHSDRDPIPDVTAVYFVLPTKENLDRIARDCSRNLYKSAKIASCGRMERRTMEEFAGLVVTTGGLGKIETLSDHYVDFVSLEGRLFHLGVKESYCLYNHPSANEEEMNRCMERICTGLFSVVATLGVLPVIRCERGGSAEMVSRRLCKLLEEHPTLRKHAVVGSGQHGSSRPVLVVMDRNVDLVTPLQHVSTYQALVDDVLDHEANRVEFSVSASSDAGNSKAPVRKKLDVDPDSDPFYSRQKFNPFPEAIESNGTELQDVTERESHIRSKTSEGTGGSNLRSDNAPSTDLATAVESLPLLLERKKKLEVHTSILQACMNEIAARDIPQFYELETALATGSYKSDPSKAKQLVKDLVTDPSKGNIDDKVRVIMVYMLAVAAKNADVDEVVQAMKESLETKGLASSSQPSEANTSTATRGVLTKQDRLRLDNGIKAIEYLKKIRSMIPSMNVIQQEDSSSYYGASGTASSDMITSFMARATNQATGLLAKATDRLGNMMGKIHKHRATTIVENIIEMRPNTEDDEYLYLDPRVKGDVDVAALRNVTTRAPVREVIAFMIGGGCYGEYQNLQLVGKKVTYGCTELVDPCTFVDYLAKLV
ncbi:hypothetical protein ACHAWO_011227 [Cyclotella atomus]|uniref:Sec1-like protein n=1 Tax=Cyclotella atomus TaxID=382360 RepID=A0ABD3PVX9_9STRA